MRSMERRCKALLCEGEERIKLWSSFFESESDDSVKMISKSMKGYNDSVKDSQAHEQAFFDSVLEVFRTRQNNYAMAFYDHLFPVGENIQYYIQRVKELLEKGKGQEWLVKSLQESLDDLEVKRRGYLCSAPDLYRIHFNINL